VTRGRRGAARRGLRGDEAVHGWRRGGEAQALTHRLARVGSLTGERAADAGGVTPTPAVDAPDRVTAVSAAMILVEAAEASPPEPP
jgi:hypothetical protein